jgi:acyl carrier protein
MTQEEIMFRLQSIFDDVFLDKVVVTPELNAHDVPEWDSLMHVTLMVSVEKSFGIRFRVGEVEATHNVGEFAQLIARRLAETPQKA